MLAVPSNPSNASQLSSALPHSRLRHTPLKLSSMLPDQERNILRQLEIK